MTIWIGRIEPSMWFEGAWWQEILPPGRPACGPLAGRPAAACPEDLERAHDQILEKVELLDAEGVDVINVGGSPVVTLHGRAGHERLLARDRGPDEPALRDGPPGGDRGHPGRRRPARPDRQPVPARPDREAGRDPGRGGHRRRRPRQPRHRTEPARSRCSTPAGSPGRRSTSPGAHPDGDVVYLPCGSLPVTSVIDRIEAQTGLPVVTCVQAQVRACLVRAGYDRPIEGYGRLLREIGAAAPA